MTSPSYGFGLALTKVLKPWRDELPRVLIPWRDELPRVRIPWRDELPRVRIPWRDELPRVLSQCRAGTISVGGGERGFLRTRGSSSLQGSKPPSPSGARPSRLSNQSLTLAAP